MTELFIRKPVATTLLTIALLLSGVLSYFFLPVSPLPEVDIPTISVNASLPGASPETMASSVATPLERQFTRIAGITEMTSSSSLGSTSVTMQFELGKTADEAAREVQAAISAARSQLPAALPGNPTYRKVNPSDAPIMILTLTSDTIEKSRIYDFTDSILGQKLAQVEGVGQVMVGGGAKPAVRVQLNPNLLAQAGISLAQVRQTLNSANANRPKGLIQNDSTNWLIEVTDQLFTAEEYRKLIIRYQNGAAVRLGDVADVTDSVEDRRNEGLTNGKPSVMVMLFRQPNANIIDTVDRVHELLPQLRAALPRGIDLTVSLDRTYTIRASVEDVQFTMAISVVLVVMVVFVFLRNVRATIIPGVVVPLSLIASFGVMYLLNYSINNLTLMALTIATGFVVDDAIVVVENVSRYLEEGMEPFEAAIRGSREIGFTVFAISVSLVAVFIPILLMGGIVGRLFREFAVTLSAAVLISMVVSLVTTPMMCSLLLRRHDLHKRPNAFYRGLEWIFDFAQYLYGESLAVVLRHPQLTLLVAVGAIGLSVYLYMIVPKGFFPQQDTGRLMGAIQASQDTSFPTMREKMKQFVDILLTEPAIETISASTGGGGGRGGGTNNARMFITLKPRSETGLTAEEVIARVRRKTVNVPGAQLFLQSPQDIRIGGRGSNSQFQFSLQGDDITELREWGQRLLTEIKTLPGILDSNTDLQDRGLEARLAIDRDTSSRLAVTTQEIDDALYDAFGQRQVSTMYGALNQYRVIMEVLPQFQSSPTQLRDIYVRSQNGGLVPLSSVTRYERGQTGLSIAHQGQYPAITLSFNLAPNFPLSQAVEEIQDLLDRMSLPANIRATFSGTAQAYQDSLRNQPLLIAAALITVYIVLGVLYESFIHPITILSTLPSAGVGAILALLVTGMEFNVIGLIGILLLIGIVKKNAILMIDFAIETERKNHRTPKEAIYEAALLRFRPILMTTMAALLGGLPLAIGGGVGFELRRPLGITIVGGLIVSQLVTLYTTPVVYVYLDRLSTWTRGRRSSKAVPVPEHQHL